MARHVYKLDVEIGAMRSTKQEEASLPQKAYLSLGSGRTCGHITSLRLGSMRAHQIAVCGIAKHNTNAREIRRLLLPVGE